MKLALGSAQFGIPYGITNHKGQVKQHEVNDIVRLARSRGVRTIDTAISYGSSEACLGISGANDFQIVTKLPALPDSCEDVEFWVRQHVNATLMRLKQSSLYGLLLHRPHQLSEPNGHKLARALVQVKEDGLVDKVGISIYSPEDIENALGAIKLDLVQTPFNIVDRRILETGWLDRLYKEGVEIHARSTFLQGLLLLNKKSIPRKFHRWNDLWNKWHASLETLRISPVELCLAFSLLTPQISKVIVGVDTADQLLNLINVEDRIEYLGSLLNGRWPDLYCGDLELINPSNWNSLEDSV